MFNKPVPSVISTALASPLRVEDQQVRSTAIATATATATLPEIQNLTIASQEKMPRSECPRPVPSPNNEEPKEESKGESEEEVFDDYTERVFKRDYCVEYTAEFIKKFDEQYSANHSYIDQDRLRKAMLTHARGDRGRIRKIEMKFFFNALARQAEELECASDEEAEAPKFRRR